MRVSDHYILDARGEPKKCTDLLTWAAWFEKSRTVRVVARTSVRRKIISTVFLGLDHGWGSRIPILWETMAFNVRARKWSPAGEMDRCSGSREQALAMHARMVARICAEDGVKLSAVKNLPLDA